MEAVPKRPSYPQILLFHEEWDIRVKFDQYEYGRQHAFDAIKRFSRLIHAVSATVQYPIKDIESYQQGLLDKLNESNHGYFIDLNGRFPFFEVYEDRSDYREVSPIYFD